MPNPGQYICLTHHSSAGNNHPTLIDDADVKYTGDCYNKMYPGPDPMQWKSEDPLEYARDVNAKVVMYPAGEPLCADAELTVPWASVEAMPGRFEINYKREEVLKRETKHCAWRCPDPAAEVPQTNHRPPLPAVLEILSESVKWDTYGHL